MDETFFYSYLTEYVEAAVMPPAESLTSVSRRPPHIIFA